MQITQQLLRRLKAEPKPYEVRDSKLKGFILRMQPTGNMSYICEYARGKRITIGRANVLTLTQARNKATEILGVVAVGKDPQTEIKKKKGESLGLFLDTQYEKWSLSNQEKSTDTVRRIRACFPDLLNHKLTEITPLQLERYRTDRQRDGRAASTINRDIAALKSVLGKAVAWHFIEKSPIAETKLKKADENVIIRYLTPSEEQRLNAALIDRDNRLKAARKHWNDVRASQGCELKADIPPNGFADHLTPIVTLLLHTGLRPREVFRLKWVDINFDQKNLTVLGANAKSKQTRHIPLNKIALKTLSLWKKNKPNSPLIFPGKKGREMDNIRKSWASLLKEADITNFRLYDLRHTFASKLVMASIDLNTVRELMGHSDIKMTLRYAHLAPEHKAAAVAALE